MSIIVYGPQGSGKSQEAGEKIAKYFGLSHVDTDWHKCKDLPEDTMAFTCFPVEGALDFHMVMAEIDAHLIKQVV
jgi:shikimate kinase